jgi:copper chaperone CopZ
MKTLKNVIIFITFVLAATSLYSQTPDKSEKTEKVKVSGQCGMCESRIEKAATIEGVVNADWSDETKILTITYNSTKTSKSEILKNVAAAGHDNEAFKADPEAYKSLPGCCKYR